MNLFLLRHGETEYTKLKRIQGQSNVSLNDEGIKMAQKIAESIQNFKITHIYCSTLKRASQTADIVNSSLKIKIIYDPRINERDYGVWEHNFWSKIFKDNPNLNETWETEGVEFRPPKGESLKEVINRTLSFFNELIKKHYSKDNILIVSHGGPLKVIAGYTKGLNELDYYKQNSLKPCELLHIKYDGGIKIE